VVEQNAEQDNEADARSRAAPLTRSPARPDDRPDLSTEIASTIERRPGDVVRCTRVGPHGYRCNWWAAEGTAAYDNPGMGGLTVTTHRVRQSQFLHVTKEKAGRLVIRVASAVGRI
jgi:hypothetical protein